MRRLVIGLGVAVALWAAGFAMFIAGIPAPAEAPPNKREAIVVFTGGPDRVTAGMAVFAAGRADRLLISGVHQNTTRERLSTLWTGDRALFDCCVDLGREALTTEGNAAEVGDWTDKHGYESLILVTSEYHMPRALVSTKARLPETEITPYAVPSGYIGSNGRPATLRAWGKLSGEYVKYLLAHIKALFSYRGN